ncbi:MAG: aminotransferase class V-fold PLP-dependent enzyme, partial [Desulfobacteraceae bacterium]|nr:aminotransferase class V-fold PLP-dependent enzyme [Desulfobacteraceae bacterium]
IAQMSDNMIYLDNAATTFPKPGQMLSSMIDQYGKMGVSPGRGSYDASEQAAGVVGDIRNKAAQFFGALDPDRVIFTANATDALNLAIQGILEPGDHVVTTRLEHNSVLRPLYHFAQSGMISYDLVSFDKSGFIDPDDIFKALTPKTKLVIVNHASNVTGAIQPVAEIGRLLSGHKANLLIDTAQSAGVVPIDMDACQISAAAFTGHKSLFGPTGTGGLVLAPDVDIRTTRFGGTGVDSKSLVHTQSFPHRLEAGTINLMGILGLSAGLDFILGKNIPLIHQHEMNLLKRLRDGLVEIKGISLYCADDLDNHVGLCTVNVGDKAPEDVGAILDADFGIAVRAGLHCAPLAHQSIGTYPGGAVRFSPGPFNTDSDIDQALNAMEQIARSRGF